MVIVSEIEKKCNLNILSEELKKVNIKINTKTMIIVTKVKTQH